MNFLVLKPKTIKKNHCSELCQKKNRNPRRLRKKQRERDSELGVTAAHMWDFDRGSSMIWRKKKKKGREHDNSQKGSFKTWPSSYTN